MEARGASYPSPFFYNALIVNKLAEELESNKLSNVEQKAVVDEALQRLGKLKACPYIRSTDLDGNLKWFSNFLK